MYLLSSEVSFDAAHFLKGYEGKCKNLHGHRWRVVVEVKGDSLCSEGPKRGMLLDFGDLKQMLKQLAEPLDHALLMEQGSLKETTLVALREEDFRIVQFPFPTTAENLSRYFYEQLTKQGADVHRVAVYETPNNCAIYYGGAEEPHHADL